ncbi:hypothetical protein CC2G_012210 [Coprinopsis cinerea AmutBmut pab1-1]|nr:hypothetical protein CC2G_012210 [Coprinopsis cinerea AmutBmut pab1-1]
MKLSKYRAAFRPISIRLRRRATVPVARKACKPDATASTSSSRTPASVEDPSSNASDSVLPPHMFPFPSPTTLFPLHCNEGTKRADKFIHVTTDGEELMEALDLVNVLVEDRRQMTQIFTQAGEYLERLYAHLDDVTRFWHGVGDDLTRVEDNLAKLKMALKRDNEMFALAVLRQKLASDGLDLSSPSQSRTSLFDDSQSLRSSFYTLPPLSEA